MADITAIAWTDSTFNAWWGCARVGPGCEHCYAATLDRRTGGGRADKGGCLIDGREIKEWPREGAC